MVHVANSSTAFSAPAFCDCPALSFLAFSVAQSLLEKNIWRSPILTDTKVHLYKIYILPVLLYGCETWTVSKTLAKRLDAFDTWCLRKISRIPHTRHTTNDTVISVTGCLPVSE